MRRLFGQSRTNPVASPSPPPPELLIKTPAPYDAAFRRVVAVAKARQKEETVVPDAIVDKLVRALVRRLDSMDLESMDSKDVDDYGRVRLARLDHQASFAGHALVDIMYGPRSSFTERMEAAVAPFKFHVTSGYVYDVYVYVCTRPPSCAQPEGVIQPGFDNVDVLVASDDEYDE